MLPELCLTPGSINFTHNPITFPAMDIVRRGLEALRDFLEPKWRTLREFKRRKMVMDSLKATRTNMTRVSSIS